MLLHLRAGFMLGLALSPFFAAAARSSESMAPLASVPIASVAEPKEPVAALSLDELDVPSDDLDPSRAP